MTPPTRSRLLVPILLPVGLLALIGLVLFGFSRILLAVTHTAATATALAVAAGVVVVAAVAASRSRIATATLASMTAAVTGIAMLAGGAALLLAAKGVEGEGEGAEGGGPAVVVDVVAIGIAFTTTELTVPADEPFDIAFDNQDQAVQHNVEIFDNDGFSGDPLFKGELIAGPASITYSVDPLPAGTYYFNCIVHPTMVGTIESVEGGGEGGGGGGGGAPTTEIAASGLMFDTTEIRLAPGVESTITMDNLDAGVAHNLSIYADASVSESLFKGDLLTGPGEIDYLIPALEPGEYYFHCDIHPTMAGTVLVG